MRFTVVIRKPRLALRRVQTFERIISLTVISVAFGGDVFWVRELLAMGRNGHTSAMFTATR